MADELNAQLAITFRKGGVEIQRQLTDAFDVAAAKYASGTPTIGTSDETLPLGDVATNGYILLHNLDATNYITLGADGSSYPVKLKPGEFALFRFNGANIHAKANTAACDLEYILISD